jgi:hypothetical protein
MNSSFNIPENGFVSPRFSLAFVGYPELSLSSLRCQLLLLGEMKLINLPAIFKATFFAFSLKII